MKESFPPSEDKKEISCCSSQKVYVNRLGMEFVLIPAGCFTMGSDEADEKGLAHEKPAHLVTISRGFYLGRHVVTQRQWEAVTGDNPSWFRGMDHPVERVSWQDVKHFIIRLNQREKTRRYRLPTEAEWEYAARAGEGACYHFGGDAGKLGLYAWYEENSGGGTHPVGKKQANAFGLCDMYGNVWEWVQDGHGPYDAGPVVDPCCLDRDTARVGRGGGWYDPAGSCHSAHRIKLPEGYRNCDLGFRLALSLEPLEYAEEDAGPGALSAGPRFSEG